MTIYVVALDFNRLHKTNVLALDPDWTFTRWLCVHLHIALVADAGEPSLDALSDKRLMLIRVETGLGAAYVYPRMREAFCDRRDGSIGAFIFFSACSPACVTTASSILLPLTPSLWKGGSFFIKDKCFSTRNISLFFIFWVLPVKPLRVKLT
jgi:hypothetical protein